MCRHCGKRFFSPLDWIIIAVAVALVLILVSAWAMSPHIARPANEAVDNASEPVQSDDQWLAQNWRNAAAMDDRYGTAAQSSCSSGADDYLRTVAAHDFDWDADAKGWGGIKFDEISPRTTGLGMMVLVSTRAKLSNGFGAFSHINLYCLYNTLNDSVVRYSMEDPTLDQIAPPSEKKSGEVVIYAPPSPTPTPYVGPVIPRDQDANYAQPEVANEQ